MWYGVVGMGAINKKFFFSAGWGRGGEGRTKVKSGVGEEKTC